MQAWFPQTPPILKATAQDRDEVGRRSGAEFSRSPPAAKGLQRGDYYKVSFQKCGKEIFANMNKYHTGHKPGWTAHPWATRESPKEPQRCTWAGRGWTVLSLLCPQAKLGARQEEALRKYLQIWQRQSRRKELREGEMGHDWGCKREPEREDRRGLLVGKGLWRQEKSGKLLSQNRL